MALIIHEVKKRSLAWRNVAFHASFMGKWCYGSGTERNKGWLLLLHGLSPGNYPWVREKPEAVPGSDQAAAASSLLPSLPTDLFIISSCIICHNLWLVRPINHASEKMRFLTRRLSVSDKQGIIQLASFSKHLLTGFGKLVLFVI